MDFFAHEDRARRASRRLVVLFILAVIVLVVGLDGAAWCSLSLDEHLWPYRWTAVAWATVVTLTMIACGSAYKIASLAGGGQTVALMLGARPVNAAGSPKEKILANVVEEMAIASGTPVPRVFVLDEPTLNAFAAGHGPSDAAIVVTHGCVELLSRDELQGVVAHEFSHLLNGDMRLNLRLIGLLHGILLIALSGKLLMRVSTGDRRSRGSPQILIVGAALAGIGYGGWLFGQLIKAALSREREFLADASAVQFTRNPSGIGGALKKIGMGSYRSFIAHENAEQFSHLYFANGVRSTAFEFFATHPPLEARIRAIDPAWDGKWTALPPISPQPPEPSPRAVVRVPLAVDAVVGHVGRFSPEHVAYGAALLASLPSALSDAARVPFSARATALAALLLAADDRAAAQLEEIRRIDAPLAGEVTRLRALVTPLGAPVRLPLIDLSIPALRDLTPPQREAFLLCLTAVTGREPPLAEYALARVLRVHLASERRPNGQIMSLIPLLPGLSVLLGELARVGAASDAAAREAFAAACSRLLDPGRGLAMPDKPATAAELDRAIDLINLGNPGVKRRVLVGCAACVACDGTVTVPEAELLRAVADCLGCPLPPFLDRAAAAA